MPQDGSNNYQYPPGTPGIPDTTIESEAYNTFLDDLVINDLNIPRPVHRGGTGASTADAALVNLHAEKAAQLVTSYSSHVWIPGSFYSATTATDAPVSGHEFAGICYINEPLANPSTNQNLALEATDLFDPANPTKYIRIMDAGLWGPWVALGGGAVRYDVAQNLTPNQRAQGRANLALTRKNFILNGAMQVNQEFPGSGTTVSGGCPVDMFTLSFANAGVQAAAQAASRAPSGSPYRLRVSCSTADASVANTDFLQITHAIEGLRMSDMGFGTANAKTVTVQFGVKAPAGTYCFTLSNYAGNRSYVAEYVIAAGEANVDTIKSVTIPGDTTGSWPMDSTGYMTLHWALMCGTNFQQAAGSWGSLNAVGSANQVNHMATAGNVWELFDVGMYEGSVAPLFCVPDYTSELAQCKRYFQRVSFPLAMNVSTLMAYSTTSHYGPLVQFQTEMRAAPTALHFASPDFILQASGTGGVNISTITLATTPYAASVQPVTSASAFTAGQAIQLMASAGAYVLFNARL